MANIGQNLSPKEIHLFEHQSKMKCVSLGKQAELSLLLLDLKLICSEWMKTKGTKALWICIYHKPVKK